MYGDHDRQTFVAAVLAGRADAGEIDDYVDAWHEAGGDVPLAEFLGMTDGEYALWVEHPERLRTLLEARRHAAAVKRRARRHQSDRRW